MSKRTTLIFSVLVAYIVLQFLWWEVLLVKQSNSIIKEKQNLVALSSSNLDTIQHNIKILDDKRKMQVYMITGEGTVFLLLLLAGIYVVRKSIKKETELSNQQKNFMLSVSHELKTPIAASKLQLQTLLKYDLEKDKQKELLTNALTETNRLHKLLDNVLLANTIQYNNLVMQKAEFNLGELLEQTLYRYFKKEVDEKDITSSINPNITYNGDKDLLQSVFINLIENAVKYSPQKIDITITLQLHNNKPVFEIIDCGQGIADNEKEKIFENFYRCGNEDTRKTKGTGIGLHIVKQICELHQIKVSVTDNNPQGSKFNIQF